VQNGPSRDPYPSYDIVRTGKYNNQSVVTAGEFVSEGLGSYYRSVVLEISRRSQSRISIKVVLPAFDFFER